MGLNEREKLLLAKMGKKNPFDAHDKYISRVVVSLLLLVIGGIAWKVGYDMDSSGRIMLGVVLCVVSVGIIIHSIVQSARIDKAYDASTRGMIKHVMDPNPTRKKYMLTIVNMRSRERTVHNVVFTANTANNHEDAKDLAAWEVRDFLDYSELPRIEWVAESHGIFSCVHEEYVLELDTEYQEQTSYTVSVPVEQ